MAARRFCLILAMASALPLFAWQAFIARYTYGGNWTAFYFTGAKSPAPPSALAESIFVHPNSFGYDGQMYHYIAHDPVFRRGFAAMVDNPRVRYRRILVPALAYVLALGQDRAIDVAYFVVMWGFVVLGAYWLSRFGVEHRRWRWLTARGETAPSQSRLGKVFCHGLLGLGYIAVPAVLVS